MTSPYYIGIDPGESGGIAWIVESGSGIEVHYELMPKTELGIWEAFNGNFDGFAYLEAVHSMPGQGVSSSFKFGMGYGGLRMALTAAYFPFDTVTPQAWQKALGIPKRKPHDKEKEIQNRKGKWVVKKYGGETDTQWKTRLCAKAQQLYPKLGVWSETKKNQLAVCDAILIATYCQRKREGLL